MLFSLVISSEENAVEFNHERIIFKLLWMETPVIDKIEDEVDKGHINLTYREVRMCLSHLQIFSKCFCLSCFKAP